MNRRLSIKTKGLAPHPAEIPEREEVLEALAGAGVPVTEEDLARRLGVKSAEERLGFERRLNAMERDGQIMRNRHGAILIAEKAGLIKGKVIGHPDGFGFLKPEDGRDDLFLEPGQMHKVLHGDIALARVSGVDRRGRLEGKIVEVLERANRKVVGRLFVEHGVAFVVAENKRINQDILITPDSVGKAKEGQVVVAELIAQPTKNSGYMLWQTTLGWQRLIRLALEPYGITQVQFVLMTCVWPMTPAPMPICFDETRALGFCAM